MAFMRLNEVMRCTGLGKSSIYKFMAAGTFPLAVPLGDRAVGWVDYEIEEWIAGKIAERDNALATITV